MAYLATLLPPESYRLDARHFPLDGNCNPHLEVRGPETVRCMAARALICVEGSGRRRSWRRPSSATSATSPPSRSSTWRPPSSTAPTSSAASSPETEAKLRDDVDYAWRFRPDGTPLVLIDGRRGTQFGPFLYAMVLTGGDADHPAFASLPPPRPDAHVH